MKGQGMSNKQTADIALPAGPGRPKGSPNRVTVVLKEAILLAAETAGEDGQGRDGLEGYCRFLAREEPRAFATLLGKVLPLQVTDGNGGPIAIVPIINVTSS